MTSPTRLFIVSAVAAAAFAAPAMAETTTITTADVSMRFEYQKGAANTDAGAREVYRKLSNAASTACRHDSPSAMRFVDRTCKADVMAEVVRNIDAPALSQVFQSSSEYARLQDNATQIASR